MARVQHPRGDAGGHRAHDIHLNEELERWVEASVITTEQAEAIRTIEERREEGRKARIPLVAEALGLLGGTLAAVAGVIAISEFWDDMSSAARLALVGAVALALLGAGWVVRRGDEPALERLGSFLWLLSTGCAAFFAGIVADVIGWEGVDVVLAASVAGTAAAVALWMWRPAPLQHVATFVGVAMSAAMLAAQVEHVGGRLVGISLWVVGTAWALLAWRDVVRPAPLGYVLGGALAVAGGLVYAGEVSSVAAEVLPIGTAVVLIAASVPAGSLALLWVGVAGVFASVPTAVARHFGDSKWAPLALFVVGMFLIGTAVFASRLVPEVRAQRAATARFSSRAVTVAVAAVIAVVFALAVAFTPFENPPSFPSLRTSPDPAVTGTVAFVRTGHDKVCIVLATASGAGERTLRCDDAFANGEVSWNAAGHVVATAYGPSGGRATEIDPATGTVVSTTTAGAPGKPSFGGIRRASDGAELVLAETKRGTWRVAVDPISGDTRTVLTIDGPEDYMLMQGAWSPDGRHVVIHDSEDRLIVVAIEQTSPSPRVLATDAGAPAWGSFTTP